MKDIRQIVDEIKSNKDIAKEQLNELLFIDDEEKISYLYESAREVCDKIYGKDIYIRGLIEFTNYCKNDCFYCGIRRSNNQANRYRLSKEQIISCCETGYELGFRTFVLQGGEDMHFTDDKVCEIVSEIRNKFSDCAITLSIGERKKESYQRFFDAGANRYLLRHETADTDHYNKLHPSELSLENRMECLRNLKEIGFQIGCGFMVGSPYQTVDTIYKDLRFIKELKPAMVGIGPFIPQHATPFCDKKAGTMEQTLRLLAIIRLIEPKVLLPATTALGTIHPLGREKGILAGANVVMPNLSPTDVRKKYELYDNKICTGDEAAECRSCLQNRIEKIGYNIVINRGDSKNV